MAGTLLERQLTTPRTGRVRFGLANRSDDADIRRLLRETPMPGQISISLEREPDYFADAEIPGNSKQTILARAGAQLACVGSCAIRDRFVNGHKRRVGYLGGLRLDHRHTGRFDILRRGYQFFRELQVDNPADFYFTSIAADNVRARAFLERGVPGMPRYEPMGEFVTVVIPTVGDRAKELRSETGAPERSAKALDQRQSSPLVGQQLAAFLNECNQAAQFAPCWSADEFSALARLGLRPADFRIQRRGEHIASCAALWDQRGFKQTVIRNYTPWLALARPLFNALAHLVGRPHLPAPGATLASAFVSHLAIGTDERNELVQLIEQLRNHAHQRRLEFLTLGFAANDPHLATLQNRFAGREYRSQLYVVHWPGVGDPASDLDDRCLAPEVALL